MFLTFWQFIGSLPPVWFWFLTDLQTQNLRLIQLLKMERSTTLVVSPRLLLLYMKSIWLSKGGQKLGSQELSARDPNERRCLYIEHKDVSCVDQSNYPGQTFG